MTEFEFVDELPGEGRGGARNGSGPKSPLLQEFAAALREQPGRWAKWPTSISPKTARSIRSSLASGAFGSLPATEFEAASRKGVAYARWTGGR